MKFAEKSSMSSKKFQAFLLSTLVWVGLMALAMWKMSDAALTTVLVVMSLVLGFVQVGYILGQAAVDSFVRMAGMIFRRNDNEDEIEEN